MIRECSDEVRLGTTSEFSPSRAEVDGRAVNEFNEGPMVILFFLFFFWCSGVVFGRCFGYRPPESTGRESRRAKKDRTIDQGERVKNENRIVE